MLKSFTLILIAAFIGVAGQLLLKFGVRQIGRIDDAAMKQIGTLVLKVCLNPYVILGLGCYGLGALVWIVVLSRVQLSFAYPLLGISYVLVLLFSAVMLREHVSASRWLGALLVVVGIAMISRTNGDDRSQTSQLAGTPSAAAIGR